MLHYILGKGTRQCLFTAIFADFAKTAFGMSDRIDAENSFAEIRSAIIHVLYNHHYEPDRELGEKVARLRDAYHNLLKDPKAHSLLSPRSIEILNGLMTKMIQAVRGRPHAEAEIKAFVEVCKKGRELFSTKNYNPDEFISGDVLFFAQMVADNYPAYKSTVNNKYV